VNFIFKIRTWHQAVVLSVGGLGLLACIDCRRQFLAKVARNKPFPVMRVAPL